MTAPRALAALGLVVLSASCASRSPSSATAAVPSKVLVIVEENHAAAAVSAGMPYLSAVSARYGHTTGYKAITHPSLPNYLALVGGSTFGIVDDADPVNHQLPGESAFDRALAAGHLAKTYAESMPSSCAQSSSGTYAVRHNPWAYFSDAGPRANCRRDDVPAGTPSSGALNRDVRSGGLPTVGLLVPNLCHDAHNGSLATADSWLKSWLPILQAGPDYRAGRLAIIVTFDEDDGAADNTVLTVVVAPHTSHAVSSRSLTHFSITRYFSELTGTSPLRSAASAPSLRFEFHL